MTRIMLHIYYPFAHWLVGLAEGWRLCELVPESERGWTVIMWRWE